MASGPITSWEIDGETVETMSDFLGFICLQVNFQIYFLIATDEVKKKSYLFCVFTHLYYF